LAHTINQFETALIDLWQQKIYPLFIVNTWFTSILF
jgi:hypothetical protein